MKRIAQTCFIFKLFSKLRKERNTAQKHQGVKHNISFSTMLAAVTRERENLSKRKEVFLAEEPPGVVLPSEETTKEGCIQH